MSVAPGEQGMGSKRGKEGKTPVSVAPSWWIGVGRACFCGSLVSVAPGGQGVIAERTSKESLLVIRDARENNRRPCEASGGMVIRG